jgi:hypothetical protein
MRSSLTSLTAAAVLATLAVVQAQFYPASPTTSGIPVSVPSKAGVPLAAGGCDEARTYDPDREPARYLYLTHFIICATQLLRRRICLEQSQYHTCSLLLTASDCMYTGRCVSSKRSSTASLLALP